MLLQVLKENFIENDESIVTKNEKNNLKYVMMLIATKTNNKKEKFFSWIV